VERDLDCKKLKNKQYNDFLKAHDSSGRVREMIKQHHSAQQRETRVTKKLGDRWRHNPKHEEIISNSSGSARWMRLTAIAIQTSSDPGLGKRFLNCA